MKYRKKDKKFVLDSLSKWKKRLNLDNWSIEVKFVDGSYDEVAEAAAVANFGTWVYKQASITVFTPFYRMDDKEKDEAILHELMHVVLAPLTVGVIQHMFHEKHVPQIMFNDLHEIVTQDLTNIISKL